MRTDLPDGFLVFLRLDRGHTASPDRNEEEVSDCVSYEEARRIQREYLRAARPCVIRYQGEVGGGD